MPPKIIVEAPDGWPVQVVSVGRFYLTTPLDPSGARVRERLMGVVEPGGREEFTVGLAGDLIITEMSKAPVFERRPLDFADVIRGLKAEGEKRFTRRSWCNANRCVFRFGDAHSAIAPFFATKAPDGVVTPWTPSQDDLRADDWQEVA